MAPISSQSASGSARATKGPAIPGSRGRRRRKEWMRDGADDLSGTGVSRDRWDGIENIPHACNEACEVSWIRFFPSTFVIKRPVQKRKPTF
jgi:hypothetical protein